MTNLEFYKEQLDEIASSGANGFAIKNGKPCSCKTTNCDECDRQGNKKSACTSETSFYQWLTSEYKEPEVDWSKVEVDTPIFVGHSDSDLKIRRYFAYYKSGMVFAYSMGATSWSTSDVTPWECAKLAKEDE